MRQDKQEIAYKQHLKDERRMEEIDKLLKEIPLVPLETKFQSGWIVSIRLRDDIARRKDAEDILKIIELGYKKEYTTNSEKDVKIIRSGKTSYTYTLNKKKTFRSLVPEKIRVDQKTYDTFTEKQKSYFYLDTFDYGFKKYAHKVYFVSLPSFWIRLKARPNIITHQRLKGGELEKEYAFLSDRSSEYWRLHTGYGYKDMENDPGRERVKTRTAIRKFIKGETDDIYAVKPRMIDNY